MVHGGYDEGLISDDGVGHRFDFRAPIEDAHRAWAHRRARRAWLMESLIGRPGAEAIEATNRERPREAPA